MKVLSRLFNNKSFQKVVMVGAIAIGAVGLLSSAWLIAASAPVSAMAGLVGGAVTLGIGCFGLHGLKRSDPTEAPASRPEPKPQPA